MKLLVSIFCLVAATTAVPLNNSEWSSFKLAHDKAYSLEEEKLRYEIFSANLDKINQHNALFKEGLESWEMGINQFSDMTEEEFLSYLTLSGNNPFIDENATLYEPPVGVSIPKSIDYRKKKAVNGVKNQKSCGSCWAFSAVASLESLHFLKSKKLLSLSEQNLVDCSKKYGNNGCKGGIMESAYNYIKDHGLETEKAYPYKAKDGACRFDKKKSVIKVKGFTKIAKNNEKALTTAVGNVGPVTVAVDASQWQHYKSGIFKVKSWKGLNHGVVVIGYGDDKGKKYYIVRNSWGAGWGEKGYIRVARDSKNQVGIASLAGYPKL